MTETSPTSTEVSDALKAVERLLDRRCEVCSGLIGLCHEQNALIEAGDSLDALMSILGRKQGLIGHLQRIEDELKPLRQTWEAHRQTADADQRTRINQLAEQAGRVLKEVLDLEEAGRSQLLESRQQVVQELTHLDKGRRLTKAYGQPKLNEARAVDHHT